jgi:8-oxo-dGTP diphosphatase
VWRDGEQGIEVLLVHRPRYDDWSHPKGKCDPGESDEACALREVEEETGLRCELGEEVASTAYRDRHGRPKRVRYWSMRPITGDFTPIDEVDKIRWLSVDDARDVLTYGHDVSVLDSLVSGLGSNAADRR